MTRETRIFVDFADIVGIEFQCPRCQATAIHKLADGFNVPNWCGNCRQDWMKDRGTDEHAIEDFVKALAMAQRLSAPLKMRLEIKEDS